MDFHWVALGLPEVTWIGLAFVFGALARMLGLPPLVGFLGAGFVLQAQGVAGNELIQKLADLGITLLLFSVGLKLNLGTLARPQVWAVSSIHMLFSVGLLGTGLLGLSVLGISMFADLDLKTTALVAFALSFSSTVFVVKVLEERGQVTSLHGRIAIGILLMQDVAAVVFLAVSSGTLPSVWALCVPLLILLRPLLALILERIGHGELLVLCGFLLALGGAEIFESVGLKGDLGALFLGVLIATHAKAEEMAKAMLAFKDLFLLGFFLSVGLSGSISTEILFVALAITPFIFLKSALFLWLLTRFKLRSRTSLLASVNLTNYSEFGLIVLAIGVSNQWIGGDWLTLGALALALSFVVAAGLSNFVNVLYTRHRRLWQRFQRSELIHDDQPLDVGGARIAIIGMGGVGTGVYDALHAKYGDTVVGVDIDPLTARNQRAAGRLVFLGDPSDADFWDRVQATHKLQLVMLALPAHRTNLAVVECLREASFSGEVAVTARFPDQVRELEEAGATSVFNLYNEAGIGFVAHVENDPAILTGEKLLS